MQSDRAYVLLHCSYFAKIMVREPNSTIASERELVGKATQPWNWDLNNGPPAHRHDPDLADSALSNVHIAIDGDASWSALGICSLPLRDLQRGIVHTAAATRFLSKINSVGTTSGGERERGGLWQQDFSHLT